MICNLLPLMHTFSSSTPILPLASPIDLRTDSGVIESFASSIVSLFSSISM
jgi:hypothetical protein